MPKNRVDGRRYVQVPVTAVTTTKRLPLIASRVLCIPRAFAAVGVFSSFVEDLLSRVAAAVLAQHVGERFGAYQTSMVPSYLLCLPLWTNYYTSVIFIIHKMHRHTGYKYVVRIFNFPRVIY